MIKTIKRRRMEGRTNYSKRFKILRGNTPRIVFRRTNKYIVGQYLKSSQAQDQVIYGVTSKKLLDYGWPNDFKGSLKSIPASYLTGLMLGKKIPKSQKVILDIGINRNIHKGRIYSFLKGLVDSGVNIKSKGEIFPDKDKLEGKGLRISGVFDSIKKKILAESKTGEK